MENEWIGKILVAVDGSEESNKAVRLAAKIAKSMGAEVTLVHVVEVKEAPSLIAEAEDKDHEGRGENILTDSAEIAWSEGVETKSVIKKGHAAGQILRLAAEYHPDMLFMGTRGLGRGVALLMGSVSRTVVQGFKGPVVIVR